jgi:Partial alpha/beta-hydrolase lipase region
MPASYPPPHAVLGRMQQTVEHTRAATVLHGIRLPLHAPCIAVDVIKLDGVLPPAELVQPYGYPLEAHTVQTEDGYLLGVFRMPRGVRSDAPVTHRFACGTSAWLCFGVSTMPILVAGGTAHL